MSRRAQATSSAMFSPTSRGAPSTPLRRGEIESWLLGLGEKTGLKARSVNLIYTAFRTILKEAHQQGIIPADPTLRIRTLAEEKSSRGILSIAEARKLFTAEAIPTIWKGNLRLFAANLLAASTGMREGEIRGLQVGQVFATHIHVKFAWEQGHGLKEAKWGSVRIVTLPVSVAEVLKKLIEASPHKDPNDLVFYGEKRAEPLHARLFIDSLYAALECIGIDEEARKARKIDFHSWRHFLNSISRGRVPDEKLRLMTGHRSVEMTDRYTHLLEEDYTEIRKVQDEVFAANISQAGEKAIIGEQLAAGIAAEDETTAWGRTEHPGTCAHAQPAGALSREKRTAKSRRADSVMLRASSMAAMSWSCLASISSLPSQIFIRFSSRCRSRERTAF
ncbi:MAG: site-specific integrase [Candidatus Moduliflexus flocculans]|nr:site-specific integrase [Candidatus Moduliflexus flocculans]